jgi:hypothetical protein
MAVNKRSHDGPDGMTPIDSPRRAEADRRVDAPISYGQSVASDDPEVAAGSTAADSERRMERAEGEGASVFRPPQPDPTRNHDREVPALRGLGEGEGRSADEMIGDDPATRPTAADRGVAADPRK